MRTRLKSTRIALAIAVQLTLATAPSSAFVVCVSADGCTAVEFALPGTANCVERDCDDGHRQTAEDEHACRDFPVLTAAAAKGSPAAHGVAPPPAHHVEAGFANFTGEHLSTPRHSGIVVTPAARSLRTTILLL